MNKKKLIVQKLLILGVVVIGLYMLINFQWGTPPAISGVGFVLAGLALWIPHCPVANWLLGDKEQLS
jgi:F0F1-type ATP synthase assembly protein I